MIFYSRAHAGEYPFNSIRASCLVSSEYGNCLVLPKALENRAAASVSSSLSKNPSIASDTSSTSAALSLVKRKSSEETTKSDDSLIQIKSERKMAKPEWHAPWKLKTVISGHTGWVRCLAVDVSNEWFASGAGDRIIKIWDLASGTLKLSLTGHISTVRGLAVSDRHPYLFSAGEDKQIKCWDLEYNKV